MKKRLPSLMKKVTNVLDIPSDILLDELSMRLEGNGRIFIDNHKGIVEYNSRQLRFKVRTGEVRVEGEDLVLKGLGYGQLTVEGKIALIEFSPR